MIRPRPCTSGPRTRPLRAAALALVLFTSHASFAPRAAMAQDYATRSAARKLGEEGIALYDRGMYVEALEKFNLADQLVPAPTLGLRAARCLIKLGRLVEASERLLEVTRMELDRAQMTPAFRKAQIEALSEREKLLPRIPSLTIEVTGPVGLGITVYVDKKQIPSAMLGQKRPVDPGGHEIEVRRGSTSVKKSIELAEGAQERAVVELPPLPTTKPEPDPTWRAIGWVSAGIGAGGMIAFGVNGALALSTQSELVEKCGEDRTCPPQFHGQADVFDMLRGATTAGLVIGIVGLGVGVPLLVATPKKAPKDDKPQGATPPVAWTPFIGPASAGVRGTF
ncbi:tetratricopeptide repeat protein [Polyangium aurulentum]|uniref:tetratricopeptide repeat protein n=1 Tax=Polyangium aurulentum TaxID=2567896 RepID=UPI0010ADEB26|nr:tetratricopeptide repeat protein [Polyangium aurulentum]UQA55375.1 tetratricopeptide repeat protein [Polyangium aurulentum]